MLKILFACLCFSIVSCESGPDNFLPPPVILPPDVEGAGTIHYVYPSAYVIIDSNAVRYLPVNLPSEYMVESLRVVYAGKKNKTSPDPKYDAVPLTLYWITDACTNCGWDYVDVGGISLWKSKH